VRGFAFLIVIGVVDEQKFTGSKKATTQ